MPVDAKEEAGDLVHLTVHGLMTTADQAALVYTIPTEYFPAESPARAWLSA